MLPVCSCVVNFSLIYYKFGKQFSVITVIYSAVILTASVLIGTVILRVIIVIQVTVILNHKKR